MNINNAITQLQAGAVGVIPTDTVYGIVADARNKLAVERLYQLKRRAAKPGTVVAANIEQLVDLGIPKRYLTAIAGLWPNPLSIVLPVGEVLDYLSQGKRSLALRIPADENLRALLEKTGPLVTTSTNHPDKPPATTIDEARQYFGNDLDFYLDGGDLRGRQPSTIIRMVDDAIEILRPGALKIDENGRIQA